MTIEELQWFDDNREGRYEGDGVAFRLFGIGRRRKVKIRSLVERGLYPRDRPELDSVIYWDDWREEEETIIHSVSYIDVMEDKISKRSGIIHLESRCIAALIQPSNSA